ncbi:hypothetical protein PAXINDRAFT_103957 [Paxillus involutus ATCC 200175]|uniref:Uncharacterized protein n=1 Tax=Paxillus involutus ATCC 200175 TaxID=664439 RepID=A0A0C9T0G4_PAXIN|nr:hypothetical protein PAXINDRAFT_103957 [Paxillus involutus ATCC 200175]
MYGHAVFFAQEGRLFMLRAGAHCPASLTSPSAATPASGLAPWLFSCMMNPNGYSNSMPYHQDLHREPRTRKKPNSAKRHEGL